MAPFTNFQMLVALKYNLSGHTFYTEMSELPGRGGGLDCYRAIIIFFNNGL